jgi:hypothetical protein
MLGPMINNNIKEASPSQLLSGRSSVFTKIAPSKEQQRLGNTALHLATVQQRPDIVKRLLAQNHQVDPANSFGETPLHIAARTGQLDIVELLLASGANIYKLNNKRKTPLYSATETDFSERKPSHSAIIKLLVAADNKLVPHYKKIWDSAEGDTLAAVTKLLMAARKPIASFWSAGSSEFKETLKFLKANPFTTQQNLLSKLEENKKTLLRKNYQLNSDAISTLNFAIAMIEQTIAQKASKYSMELTLPTFVTR